MRHTLFFLTKFIVATTILLVFTSCNTIDKTPNNGKSSKSTAALENTEKDLTNYNDKGKIRNETKAMVLAAPTWKTNNQQSSATEKITLVYVKAESNNITDVSAWVKKYNIDFDYCTNSTFKSSDKILNCGVMIPQQWKGLQLNKTHYGESYNIAIYGNDLSGGNHVVLLDALDGEIFKVYDFSKYLFSPNFIKEDANYITQSVQWAQLQNDVLYVANYHNTYAKSSGNLNGYINAINVKTNEVLWRSDALVCNSNNFVLYKNYIIAGYGFTAEDDFLYFIDKTNGKTYGRSAVKTAPEWLYLRDEKLYVRSYNTDYIVTIAMEGSGADIEKIE